MDKTIVVQSTDLFYRVEGDGYPVVLLHGFSEDGSIWDQQVNFLQDHVRVLVPDISGSGKSHYNERLRSMDDYAQIVKTILDKEGIRDCILIGHSMGGYIALAFADKYPELLKGFGLFHSTAFADSEEKKQTRKKGIAFIRDHGSREFVASTLPNLFSDQFKKNHPDTVRKLIEKYAGLNPAALINYYEAMIARPDRTAVLKKLTVPVLFIMGEEDKAVPMEDTLKQAHLPAIADIYIFKNTGHTGMLENTKESNEVLKHFLDLCLDTHASSSPKT